MFPAKQPKRMDQDSRLDPQQVDPNLAEALTRLRSIRTEISVLTAQDHRPLGDLIVHDLDEVIERAGLAASGLLDHPERPSLTESRSASTHKTVHLPSGPDYPPPNYR